MLDAGLDPLSSCLQFGCSTNLASRGDSSANCYDIVVYVYLGSIVNNRSKIRRNLVILAIKVKCRPIMQKDEWINKQIKIRV